MRVLSFLMTRTNPRRRASETLTISESMHPLGNKKKEKVTKGEKKEVKEN